MACACKQKKSSQYLWFKDEGTEPVVYDSEIQAKAKVLRKGGSYVPYVAGQPLAPQIAAAFAAASGG